MPSSYHHSHAAIQMHHGMPRGRSRRSPSTPATAHVCLPHRACAQYAASVPSSHDVGPLHSELGSEATHDAESVLIGLGTLCPYTLGPRP